MPKAEVGSTKHLNNKLKSKGLQRLRWYCQVCERQMRDANGFKMHTEAESHVRQMLLVGEDPKKFINDYSKQFQRDFLQLLRTSHGEKQVHLNHFYQEYIGDKNHIHQNATKWPSLTEFAKFLGREGICRVEETDKGIHIAWIDSSPDALRRQDAIRKRERQDKGDEEREQSLIKEQIRRANLDADARRKEDGEEGEEAEGELKRAEGEKIKLSFASKSKVVEPTTISSVTDNADVLVPAEGEDATVGQAGSINEATADLAGSAPATTEAPETAAPAKVSLKMGIPSKPKNVFATAKKNALGGKKVAAIEQPKKMSEAERIMKEEIQRKRGREGANFGAPGQKKQRF